MKNIQHEGNSKWMKLIMKKIQHDKSSTWINFDMKTIKHEGNLTWRKCNMKKLQHEGEETIWSLRSLACLWWRWYGLTPSNGVGGIGRRPLNNVGSRLHRPWPQWGNITKILVQASLGIPRILSSVYFDILRVDLVKLIYANLR